MWELDHKEGWELKNWYFWTVVLEKTLENPLDCKEIYPVNPKGNEFWIFIGRTDVEAEATILWPPNANSRLIGKDPDAGKDWGQEEKGTTEDEMVGWHQWLNGHEFEQAPGVGEGQGGLVCCSPWGHKELDKTEWLNWTEPHFSSMPHFFLTCQSHQSTHFPFSCHTRTPLHSFADVRPEHTSSILAWAYFLHLLMLMFSNPSDWLLFT